MCSAAITMLAACDLPSREVGSKRERWTILEPADADDVLLNAVAATADDGVVVAGRFSYGPPEAVLRRYDADGELRWAASFVGGGASEQLWVTDVAVAIDGSIVVAAEGYDDWIPEGPADGPEYVALLFGFGPDGTQRWERRVDGARSLGAVTALPDGTFAYAGTSTGDDAVIVGVVSTAGELGTVGGMPVGGEEEPSPSVMDMAAQSDGRLVLVFHHSRQVDCVGFDAALAPTWSHSSEEGFVDGIVTVGQDDTIWWVRRSETRIVNGDQSRSIVNDNRLAVLAPDGTLVREVEGIEPDLNPLAIALGSNGAVVLAGRETHDVVDYQLAVAEIDPESGETLWFDTAGGHPNDVALYSEDYASDLTVTTSGEFVAVGIYDDSAARRGWLRRYAAGPAEEG